MAMPRIVGSLWWILASQALTSISGSKLTIDFLGLDRACVEPCYAIGLFKAFVLKQAWLLAPLGAATLDGGKALPSSPMSGGERFEKVRSIELSNSLSCRYRRNNSDLGALKN